MGAVQAIGRAVRTYFVAWLRPARDMEKLAVLHGATYYLTWSNLLPHVEKLAVSLSRRPKTRAHGYLYSNSGMGIYFTLRASHVA